MGKLLVYHHLHLTHRIIYLLNGSFEVVKVAVFGAYGLFPVPLVHIERVEVVKILAGADSVHVGIKAVARSYVIGGQLGPLPFGQRVYHLSLPSAHTCDIKRYRLFHTVKVVIETCA